MLAPHPREHLTNTNQSKTSDILVAFSKGVRQRLNLRTKPLQHARDSGISSEKVQALPPKHGYRLLHIMAKPSQFFAQQATKLLPLSRYKTVAPCHALFSSDLLFLSRQARLSTPPYRA
jgi:hypothetical protein